jgi:hypothetical protein
MLFGWKNLIEKKKNTATILFDVSRTATNP